MEPVQALQARRFEPYLAGASDILFALRQIAAAGARLAQRLLPTVGEYPTLGNVPVGVDVAGFAAARHREMTAAQLEPIWSVELHGLPHEFGVSILAVRREAHHFGL